MITSFLESVDHASYENIEEDDVSFSLTDEKNVWIVGMGIHGSNSSILLADISAEFTSNSSFFDIIDKDLTVPSFVIFLLNILLETSCEM